MNGPPPPRELSEMRRGVRELALATLALVAVAIAVAAVVFGLIVVLYDHGEPAGHAAVAGLPV
jgi:hypothetical protein